MRLFCAVELPGDVREQIVRHAARLRQSENCPGVRWVRGENLHLTLKFFGQLIPERAAAAVEALSAAAAAARPFGLRVAGAGAFTPPGRQGDRPPRVLWLGVHAVDTQAVAAADNPLLVLWEAVERACAGRGFEREGRAFRPHVTVARLDSGRLGPGAVAARRLAERHAAIGFASPLLFAVNEVALMRSDLRPGGSTYAPVTRFPLAADGQA